MSNLNAETVFVVGAGFSHHAGLPLTNGFTEAMLEARGFGKGPSRITVDFLSKFIHDTFDHSVGASAKRWPDLEDVFTCVDLAANSGHHLGRAFSPADLRTVRRALLFRILRMLDQKYQSARRTKSAEWRRLDDFFARTDSLQCGFISMNCDTVIERKLQLTRSPLSIDYGCDARPANIQDAPNPDDYRRSREYAKELKNRQTITVVIPPKREEDGDNATPLIKIHGSANWLYCDNCRQLYWFHPDQCRRIADQLIREDDLRCLGRFLKTKKRYVETTIAELSERIQAIVVSPWENECCMDCPAF